MVRNLETLSRRRSAGAVGLAAVLLAVSAHALPSAASSPDDGQRPNLVPSVRDILVWTTDPGFPPGPALRFSTRISNLGAYALDLLGVPDGIDDAGRPTAAALQCTAWAGDACTGREPVGTFVWHAAHAHYHFEDLALYELRLLTPTGAPDMSEDGLVASSGKVGFCLMDVEPADPDDPPPGGRSPLHTLCSFGVQGISPGWADVYSYGIAGQQIPLDGVADGEYAFVVTVDPDRRLLQTTHADDTTFERITIAGGGTTVNCADASRCRSTGP